MSDSHDIYRILESLDAAQKSVKQLPALFKPKDTSPQLSGPYPGVNATRGYLVGEDAGGEDNPMIQAVHRRIVFNRPEWITKYGVDAIDQAVIDVVGDHWDGEEIGSSDVSAYIHMIGEYLRDHGGSREEMDDRRPFAEQGLAEGHADQQRKIFKRNGQPVGEVGIDRESSPGAGQWYMKCYAYNIDNGGYDSYEEAVAELKHCLKQGVTEGIYPGQFKTKDEAIEYAKEKVKSFRDPLDGIEIWAMPSGGFDVVHTMNANGRNHSIANGGKKIGTISPRYKGVSEGTETATEDVISTVKKKLGDYLQDVATAIQKDPDLLDKVDQAIDQVGPAVKTIKTDDGHEIKIHGNEDDGFRISIKNQPGKSKFKTLDEASMACEMYCAHRRQKAMSADYIEEKQIS